MADADQQTAVTEWDEQGNPVKPGAATAAPTEWDEKGNPVTPKAAAPPMGPGSFQQRPKGPVLNASTLGIQGESRKGTTARLGAPEASPYTPSSVGREAALGLSSGFSGMPEVEHPLDALQAQEREFEQHPVKTIAKETLLGPAPQLYGIGKGLLSAGAETAKGLYHLNPEEVAHGGGSAVGQLAALGLMRETPESIRETGRRSLAKVTPEIKEAAPPNRNEINYEENLERAKPYLAEQQRISPVTNKTNEAVRQSFEASNSAVAKIEEKIGKIVDSFPQDTISGNDVLAKAREILKNPKSPRTPEEIERGMKALEGFGLEGDMPLKDADRLRWRLNRDNDSEMGMTEAKRGDVRASNPAFAAKEAAADALRDSIYGHLRDNRGVEGIDELRLDEGAVLQQRDAFRRNIVRSEKSNPPSSMRRLGVFGPVGLGLLGETLSRHFGAPPGISTGLGVGTAGLYEYMRGRLQPNPTMARAMGRLGRSELAPNYPEIPPPPQIRGKLPAPPVEAGYPAEPQGRVSFQPRQLAGEQPIEAEFIPRRVNIEPALERAGIGRMLPESTTPQTNIPPAVEPKYAREQLGKSNFARTEQGPPVSAIHRPVKGELPTPGEAPAVSIGKPLPTRSAKYKPSEKAETMSAKPRNLGPEFTAQEWEEEISRNKSILRNRLATAEEKSIARDRLRDAEEAAAKLRK